MGELVRVSTKRPLFPADMILIHTENTDSVVHVETKSLDGESNLKIKTVHKDLQ